ncbi:MAG: hypothetical protein JSV19_06610 [Phycisphaerales bacterium]|nr:MAG: hypothetical protein JSV19_06610 [Phycisphaerales bacterium]
MEARRRRNADRRRYQSTRAIETALMTTVLPGVSALAFGTGALHNAKADLQRATDAASLAASVTLSQDDVAESTVLPPVTDKCPGRRPAGDRISAFRVDDAEFGRAVRDDFAGGHGFAVAQAVPDAALAHTLNRGRAAVDREFRILAVTVGAGRQPT